MKSCKDDFPVSPFRAVAQMSSVTNIERETCGSLRGLTKRQIKLCRRNVEHMDSVKFGAFIAINECQYQFRHRRWNCSIPQDSSMFGDILRLGKKECMVPFEGEDMPPRLHPRSGSHPLISKGYTRDWRTSGIKIWSIRPSILPW